MSRLRAALFAVTCAGAGLCGASGAVHAQTVPPSTSPAAPVTPPVTAPAPATTLPAGTRGGADAGSVVKPREEPWSAERLAVTTGLIVVALAAIGYVYGKVRSTPPKHPDLVAGPDDLERTG